MTGAAPLARGSVPAAADAAPEGLLGATLAAVARRADEPGWLASRRAEAARWLSANGFPTPRDEAFRFTPVRDVTSVAFARSRGAAAPPAAAPVSGFEDRHVVLVNGAPQGPLPGGGGAPLTVERLGDALARSPGELEPHLGAIATVTHGFVAQNTALLDDALVIRVARGARERLLVTSVAAPAAGPTLSTPRVLVLLEPTAELMLAEWHLGSGQGKHLESSVTELSLGQGSRLEHVRAHARGGESACLGTVAVRQLRDSSYVSRTYSFGGSPTRLDLRVLLEEPGAEASLDGLYVARSGELVDHHTVVEHAAPRCTSRQRYKGILDGTGTGVFDGTVVVRRGAAGTEAHQETRNLLLSGDAVVHAKPHLEIDTDDVKCSHGATVGRLSPEQLFYLRARGMDEPVARALLTLAFARELVLPVTDPALRAELSRTLAALVPGGPGAEELS